MEESEVTTVITGARALVGPDLEPVEEATLVIRDGCILAVGAASDIETPAGAAIVDATGFALIPGFIDSHVHIGFAEPIEVLRGGVTTVRDLAWPPAEIWTMSAESTSASYRGPEILAAGQMLTVPNGYPLRATWAPEDTGRAVRSAAEARQAVDEQAESGACIIKVALNSMAGPTLDAATLEAIVEAAHARGLSVTGHVHGLSELQKALEAGMDELAHMLMSPESIPPTTLKRMVNQSMTVVPTLSCFFDHDQAIAVDNLRAFLDAGGRFVYGTDLGNVGPRPGIDPREVDALARAGVGATDIVASATTRAADHLGLTDRGMLEPGLYADVAAVLWAPGGEPVELTQVGMVWRRGRRIR
ncbi:MAG: amidohydrolase family protein [Actinomycetota bacterium]